MKSLKKVVLGSLLGLLGIITQERKMYVAQVKCSCGQVVPVRYVYREELFLNRIDCGCGLKSIPRYAKFDGNDREEE